MVQALRHMQVCCLMVKAGQGFDGLNLTGFFGLEWLGLAGLWLLAGHFFSAGLTLVKVETCMLVMLFL